MLVVDAVRIGVRNVVVRIGLGAINVVDAVRIGV